MKLVRTPSNYCYETLLSLVLLLSSSLAIWPREFPRIGLNRWSELDEEEHGIWRTDFENITHDSIQVQDQGRTFAVSSEITGLVIDCNASYPIKWVAHSAEDVKDLPSYFINVRHRRKNPDVFNPRSNLFTAQISFFGEESAISGNYSCISVEFPDEVLKSIYVFWEGEAQSSPLILAGKSIEVKSKDGLKAVIPCRVSRPDVTVQLLKKVNAEYLQITSPYVKYDPKVGFTINLYQYSGAYGLYKCVVGEDDDEPLLISLRKGTQERLELKHTLIGNASMFFDQENQLLNCCSNSSKPPKMNVLFCFYSFSCDLIFRRSTFQKFANMGKKSKNGTCTSTRIYHKDSGLVRCIGDGIDSYRMFYTELPIKANNNTPPIHFDWKSLKSENLIDISINSRRPIYNLQNITFNCDTAYYYFAEGMQWAIRWNNGSLIFFKKIRDYDRVDSFYGPGETAFQSIRIQVHKNMTEVVCFAPVWNSTDWANKSISLEVHDVSPPVFEYPDIEIKQFELNSTEQMLECRVSGVPPPVIRWKKDNKTILLETNLGYKRLNGTNYIMIHRVSHNVQGEYKCLATNLGGNAEKVYVVYVQDPSSSLGALGTVFLILILVGLVGGMGFLIWKMQLQRKVIDHLAGIVFRDVGANGIQHESSAPPSTTSVENNNHSNNSIGRDVHILNSINAS